MNISDQNLVEKGPSSLKGLEMWVLSFGAKWVDKTILTCLLFLL